MMASSQQAMLIGAIVFLVAAIIFYLFNTKQTTKHTDAQTQALLSKLMTPAPLLLSTNQTQTRTPTPTTSRPSPTPTLTPMPTTVPIVKTTAEPTQAPVLPRGTGVTDRHVFTYDHPMLVALSHPKQGTQTRLGHDNDENVKLGTSRAPTMKDMQNQMWAIMPTPQGDGYTIRSSHNQGEYLGVQNCNDVRTQMQPFSWEISSKGDHITIMAQKCGPKYLALLENDTVGLSSNSEYWIASNVLAGTLNMFN